MGEISMFSQCQTTWPRHPRREAQHAEAQETHDAHGDDATAAHGDLGAATAVPRIQGFSHKKW